MQRERGTTTIGKLHGLWSDASGKWLLIGLVGLMGLPPFGICISEFLIIAAAALAHAWAALTCALAGILVAFLALVRLAIDTQSGAPFVGVTSRRGSALAFAAVGSTAAITVLLALAPFVSTAANLVGILTASGPH